jgi:hypothetical protein
MFQEAPPSSKGISDGGLAALSNNLERAAQAFAIPSLAPTKVRASPLGKQPLDE